MTRMTCVRANPQIIKWARTNSGRRPEQIAKRLSITPEAYAEFESGVRHPTLSQLRNFANLVKRPLATFYLPSAPPDVAKPKDYRASSGALGREAMLSFRKAARVQELSAVPFKSDTPLFRIQADLNGSPARVARQAREALGLTADQQSSFRNSTDFTNWLVESLGGLGVHVLFHRFPVNDCKAYTLPGKLPVIVVNRRDFLNSQLFSVLHELCHLLLRKPGMCDTFGTGGPSTVETYCNRFAAAFIIPTPALRQVLPRFDSESLEDPEVLGELARYFSTSRDVVLLKLVEIDAVDSDAYTRLRARWDTAALAARRAQRGGRTSVKADALGDNGTLFVREVAAAYASNQLDAVDAADLLGVNPSYLEDVVGVVGGGG